MKVVWPSDTKPLAVSSSTLFWKVGSAERRTYCAPAGLAFGYARLFRPRFRGATFVDFDRHGAWRNASLAECLPSRGADELIDVTEEAGYGWTFFSTTARSRLRRAALPMFAVICGALRAAGRSPSLALPYFNLVLQKRPAVAGRTCQATLEDDRATPRSPGR